MPREGVTNTEHAGEQRASCWFCGRASEAICQCGRPYCNEHGFNEHCMLCALGFGLYEREAMQEPVSGLILLGLRAASGDPYVVVPPALQYVRPLPLLAVERVVATLVRMLQAPDDEVRRRAGGVLAATTNSWPTLDPSPLVERTYGISLLAADQVRRWLLTTLKAARHVHYEAIALAILERLQTADFRDLYPAIQENLTSLSCGTKGARVREVFDMLTEFYPTHSPLVNERCELMVYEHYNNPARGAKDLLERTYGPLLKYSPILRRILKKGTWLASQARYEEWYFGEGEPV